jgi:hypothetical protein
MKAGFCLASLLACAACSPPAATANAPAAATTPTAVAERPVPPRFDQEKVAAMKKQLLAEPKIGDVLYQDGTDLVDWTVAVRDDGTSRVGYATYVCQVLRDGGLVDRHTDLRVVDIAKAERSGDFRSASLGHVDCTSGENLGV